uniref:NUC153 domain-containing protein n=1 Tax=Globisporangium ultimum (strain ATCC 200006 / CBS 805.95 / DAOM BR144) TaxID=431595 RepID=K3WSS7_GLOUD
MKKLEKKTGLQEGFEFDAADPRFGALYAKGSQFQLDPTDPKFKKTEANQKIFQERRKRNEKAGNSGTQPTSAPASSAASTGDSKSELKAIVENLKRKSHQQRKPSVSKKQKL